MGRKRTRLLVGPDTTLAVASIADRPWTRMIGLLGRAGLDEGDGLVIEPCDMIHTWFMRFPIDVLFVDRQGLVVNAVREMGPFRVANGRPAATTTIELPAGTLKRAGVHQGMRVRMEPA
jgi:uncharacterized membrane protein (UPF0127 family)